MKDKRVGVVVGRFQSPELHAGHRFIIDHACVGHADVLIVIGSAQAPLNTHDPLDYETRKAMIQNAYPQVRIAELKDCRHDDVWSKKLDAVIAREFPGREVVLFGSRGSFIPHYSGIHPCLTVHSIPEISATAIRNHIADTPLPTVEFRSGMIYAACHRPPLSYQTVDVAVVDHDGKRVLLGRRNEEHGMLRFIGGFVDKDDVSLESAARRETFEETSRTEVDDFKYLGSFRIADWRYSETKDGILTAFFAASYIFGAPRASDDLDGLEWLPFDGFLDKLVDEHKPLGKKLLEYLASQELEKGKRQ